jgi:hypothetical protein
MRCSAPVRLPFLIAVPHELQFIAYLLHLEDVDAMIFEVAAGVVGDLADGGFEIERVQGVVHRLHLSIIRIING